MASIYKYKQMEAKMSPLLLIKVKGENQIVLKGSWNFAVPILHKA